ncbi:MAG: polysaccharide pyruvyl transferase family protein, partial [Akkermansiaceae bacterium]|nr:polysaccharide pyruvyl transferase family protein [Akkermansiaceae bacterium]
MRVGILTYHAAHNYGAVLQAYALQTELQCMGHEPSFIHYYPDTLEAKNHYRRPIRSTQDLARAAAYKLFRGALNRRFERFNRFRDERLRITRRFRSFEDLAAEPPEFDTYICGSDQIWNFSQGASPVYFLRFLEATKPAVAYAPSFGSSFGKEDVPAELSAWINRFQYLSAREASGGKLIEELTGRPVPQVMDPAFLLTADEWAEVASTPTFGRPYILFYALEINPFSEAVIGSLATRLGLPIVVAGKGGYTIFRR